MCAICNSSMNVFAKNQRGDNRTPHRFPERLKKQWISAFRRGSLQEGSQNSLRLPLARRVAGMTAKVSSIIGKKLPKTNNQLSTFAEASADAVELGQRQCHPNKNAPHWTRSNIWCGRLWEYRTSSGLEMQRLAKIIQEFSKLVCIKF